MRQRVAPVDRGEWVRKAVDLHHCDVVIAEQLHHSLHKTWYKQRHIATGHVCGIDGARQGCQPGAQSFEWPPLLAFITCDSDITRQLRYRLLTRRNNDDGRNNRAQQPHHALQHRLGTKRQCGFSSPHSCGPSPTQNDAAGGHNFIPRRRSASLVDACRRKLAKATTLGRSARDRGTMKSYCSACTGRNPSPAWRATVSSVIPQSARPCTTAAATAL